MCPHGHCRSGKRRHGKRARFPTAIIVTARPSGRSRAWANPIIPFVLNENLRAN